MGYTVYGGRCESFPVERVFCMKKMMWLVAGCMLAAGIAGCRYADGHNVRLVGNIDWDNPSLVLHYDEHGAPFAPREVLTVRFADRMLQCECFEDYSAFNLKSPYLRLSHKCDDSEWRYVCSILKGCRLEKWRVSYCPPPGVFICDGTFWSLKISWDGVEKGIYGDNEYPGNFDQFMRLKKYAMEHPAAVDRR